MNDARHAVHASAAAVMAEAARLSLPAFRTPASSEPATREGQRELVAAALAAAVIAAGRDSVCIAEAVERYREVLGALEED